MIFKPKFKHPVFIAPETRETLERLNDFFFPENFRNDYLANLELEGHRIKSTQTYFDAVSDELPGLFKITVYAKNTERQFGYEATIGLGEGVLRVVDQTRFCPRCEPVQTICTCYGGEK